MYTAMLGAAACMNWRGGIKTSQGIFWFAMGGILGWPFAAALSAPFILEEVVLALFGDKEGLFEAAIRLARGGVSAVVLIVSRLPDQQGCKRDQTRPPLELWSRFLKRRKNKTANCFFFLCLSSY
jgi:alpha-1,2-mannosyltransferase